MPSPALTLSVPVEPGFRPGATLGPLRMGVSDPCWRVDPDGSWWWATRTPDGPVTLRLAPAAGAVTVDAWGDGAVRVEALSAAVLGRHDRPEPLAAHTPDDLVEQASGFRLARSTRVVDAAVGGVCRRGVSAFEAGRSWSSLVESLGDDAPGPGGLRLPPAPRRLAAAEPYDLHVLGLEQGRADEVRRIASYAPRLELTSDEPDAAVVDRLRDITGVGADVVEHVRSVALGDPDALPIVDANHSAAIVRVLRAPGPADDQAVAALLGRFRPQRGRIVRLVGLATMPEAAPPLSP